MRVGGWFGEARSARGREMNAKMAVTRRSTVRRLAIDESTQKGRARKRRGFVSPAWLVNVFGRGADARDLTRGGEHRAPRCAASPGHAPVMCAREAIRGRVGVVGELTWMATKKRPPW